MSQNTFDLKSSLKYCRTKSIICPKLLILNFFAIQITTMTFFFFTVLQFLNYFYFYGKIDILYIVSLSYTGTHKNKIITVVLISTFMCFFFRGLLQDIFLGFTSMYS